MDEAVVCQKRDRVEACVFQRAHSLHFDAWVANDFSTQCLCQFTQTVLERAADCHGAESGHGAAPPRIICCRPTPSAPDP